MRILFADDNPDTRDLFQIVFSLSGHNTLMASDGAQAVRWAQTQEFDIAVLDLEMPIMDGLAALRCIRQMPRQPPLPVVIFTGYQDDETRNSAQASGANLILYKPLMPLAMLQQLEKLVA